MKNEQPVSLFSFQDIITSLTGIMLVIILVTIVQILNVTAKTVVRVSENEINELREKLDEQTRRHQILDADNSVIQYLQTMPTETNDEVAATYAREMRYGNQLKNDLTVLQIKADTVDKEKQHAAEIDAGVAFSQKQNTESLQRENDTIRLKVAESAKKIVQLNKDVAERKTRLEYIFPVNSHKKSVLVECNRWGVRVKNVANNTIVQYGNSNTTLAEAIPQLKAMLLTLDHEYYYPILFVRESTFAEIDDLTDSIVAIKSELELGRELILDDEECF